jgi:hypothetical protein
MTVQLPSDRHLRILKELRTVKEKNLQKEDDFCVNSSNFDWDAFRYKDTTPQGISFLYSSCFIFIDLFVL